MYNIKSLRSNLFYSSISILLPSPAKQGLMTIAGGLALPKLISASFPPVSPVDATISALFLAVSVIGFLEVGEADNAISELNKAGKIIPTIQSQEDDQIKKVNDLINEELQQKQSLEKFKQKILQLEIEKNNLKQSEQDALQHIELLRQSIEKMKESEENLKKALNENNNYLDRMVNIIRRLREQLLTNEIQPIE